MNDVERVIQPVQLPLFSLGSPGESHREQAQEAAIAVHTFVRGVAAGRLHALVLELDVDTIEAEVGL